MADEERYCGLTLHEAVSKAMEVGTLGAWEWLQAWWNTELPADEEDRIPPDQW